MRSAERVVDVYITQTSEPLAELGNTGGIGFSLRSVLVLKKKKIEQKHFF